MNASAGELRAECLRHVSRGETDAALDCARRLVEMRPDESSKRLLAVCCLLAGDFASAAALAASRS